MSIEQELLELIRRPSAHGTEDLVDEFRRGRDIRDLLCLLRSQNRDVLLWALRTVTEVKFNRATADIILPRLEELCEQRARVEEAELVRFMSINALLSTFADLNGEPGVMEKLTRFAESEDVELSDGARATIAVINATKMKLAKRRSNTTSS